MSILPPAPDDPPQARPTSVYRYYDASHILIYVGITSRGMARNAEHDKSKAWWHHVARQEIDHYMTREEAEGAERELIETFRPPYNTQHNPDAAGQRSAYEAFAALLPEPINLVDVARSLRHRMPLDYWGVRSDRAVFATPIRMATLVGQIPEVRTRRIQVTNIKCGRVVDYGWNGPRLMLYVSGSRLSQVIGGTARFICTDQKRGTFAISGIIAERLQVVR